MTESLFATDAVIPPLVTLVQVIAAEYMTHGVNTEEMVNLLVPTPEKSVFCYIHRQSLICVSNLKKKFFVTSSIFLDHSCCVE